MLNFVLWKWKQKPMFRELYRPEYVNAAVRMIDQRVRLPHRVICVTDDPRGVECPTHPLWDDHRGLSNISGQHLPSCYRRLKLFDPSTQLAMGIPAGERVVSVDVDAVGTNDMTHLFTRREPFVGWTVKGSQQKLVLNGSMFMFTAGDYQHVWSTFDPRTSPMRALNSGFMGSDQGWMSKCLIGTPGLGGWTQRDGVLSFTRDVVKGGVAPSSGCIVFFAGNRKPWHAEVQDSAPWVSKYVRYDERAAA